MSDTPFPVVVEAPEHMNLIGLMMRGLLEENLAKPRSRARARGLRGAVRVQAGGMAVVLDFDAGGLTIRMPREGERYRARVRGGMTDLLGVVNGRLFGPVLSARVRIGGNPFFLLGMLPLIRSE
jgi:hypothetical protein